MESWLSGRFIGSLRTVASGLPCFKFRFARDSGRTVAHAGKTDPALKVGYKYLAVSRQRSADIQNRHRIPILRLKPWTAKWIVCIATITGPKSNFGSARRKLGECSVEV
jgi:hypothetical protein